MKKIRLKNSSKACPCGSGKKYKKCCLNKPKDRITYVTVDMGVPKEVNGIKFDPRSGEVIFLHDGNPVLPVNAHVETGYDRTKKFKVLNKAKLPMQELNANPNRRLETFDLIFAIDTNSKTVGNETISVSCVVGGRNVLIPNHTAIRYGPANCLEFRNIRDKAENIAWQKCIELIQAAPEYKPSLKICMIVDSDLSNIPRFNSRELPIYGTFYLPENFELLYASTDSGKENIANQMIARCEKEASHLLQQIMNDNNRENLEIVHNQPYTHFKLWVRDNDR